MTIEQAYAEGFCKAAEAMGVDPEALYKQALPAWMARAGGWIARGGAALAQSRAGQAVTNGTRRFGSWIGSHGGNALAQSRAGQAVTNGARRFGQLLAGGNDTVRGAFRMGRGDLSGMDKLRGWFGTYWQGLRGSMGGEAASELRKSLAARLGTGAAALGGGAMLFGGGGDQQEAG